MCCFSLPVNEVSATSIFARALGDGRQALIYEMSLDAASDLAMVLPIPVVPRAAEDAVRFVSLAGYPELFRHLESAFPVEGFARFQPQALAGGPVVRAPLVVHDVGDFEASFVPTMADLDRLDPRFRLPREVWAALGGIYDDWGFAVFKLKVVPQRPEPAPPGFFARLLGRGGAPMAPPSGPKRFHPMAFTFPQRDPSKLFFPTVHVHDGRVHPTAHFDHALYLQTTPTSDVRFESFERSERPATFAVDHHRSGELIELMSVLHRRKIVGDAPNRDVWIDLPS